MLGLARNVLLPYYSCTQRWPQDSGEGNSFSVQNCEQYSLLFTMCGENRGLIQESTLTAVPDGTTIKDQREGSLEKWQVDDTMKVGLEYANIHISR